MKILEPIKVGKLTLKNRVMFPPLTTGYEERDGRVGKKSFNFYKRLAEGGVGYIVIGDVVPTATLSPTPKLFNDQQEEAIASLADELHKYDAKLGLQIFHPEYDCDALMKMMAEGKSREEIFAKLHYDMQHFVTEVSHDGIREILAKITACVRRAVNAGVDVIEVHGDRLVGSLCSTILNHRTDEYGGSFENRTRFALEFVKAIRDASKDIVIDYKMPIVTKQHDGSLLGKGGLEIEEAVKLSALLEKAGVNMIHVAQANHTGNMNDTIPAMGTRDYFFMEEETKLIKNAVSIPVSAVGRILIKDANKLIEEGACDIVAFGRGLLADQDIVKKLEAGKENTIRQCICCNKGCTDHIMQAKFLACVLNPENGYEYERVITKPQRKHNVLIVGAGIAGLEAAVVARKKGHNVLVIEKSSRPYGQINIASLPPRKAEMTRIYEYYDHMIKELDIKISYNTPFTNEIAASYDDIIIATGARNATPNISGIENTLDAWEVLEKPELAKGKVVILGGGLVGCETAELLASLNKDVTIVEMDKTLAKEESKTILPEMMSSFKAHNVGQLTLTRVKEITKDAILVEKLNENNEVVAYDSISYDTAIRALSSTKDALNISLSNKNIIYVGDCLKDSPCTIDNATKTAYDAANSLN